MAAADDQPRAWEPEAIRAFEEVWAWYQGMRRLRGEGLTNSPFGPSLCVPRRRRGPIRAGGEGAVLVKITGNSTGGGKYEGKILTSPLASVTASGDLAQADVGELPDTVDALIVNTREVGSTAHDLTTALGTTPLIFLGRVVGDSDQGLTEVVIEGDQLIVAMQADVNVVTGAKFVNVRTVRGTSNILEWTDQTVSGQHGAGLQFKDAGSDYQVLQRNGTNVVWDYVRGSA